MYIVSNMSANVGHHFALSLTLRSRAIGDDFISEMGLFIACRMIFSVPNGCTTYSNLPGEILVLGR